MRRGPDDSGKRGFTLIEVLVVVAIIALLISILLPSLARARDQARKAVCMNNQKQLANAMYYYSADHAGRLPHFDYWLYTDLDGTPGPDGLVPQCGQLFGIQIPGQRARARNYAVNAEIYKCPSDKGQRHAIAGDSAQPIRPPTFSYTTNTYIMVRTGFAKPLGSGGTPSITESGNYMLIQAPKRPAESPLMVEEYDYAPMNDGYFVNNERDFLSTRHGGRQASTVMKTSDVLKDASRDDSGLAMISYYDLHVATFRSRKFNDYLAGDEKRHHILAPGYPFPGGSTTTP